MKTESLAIDLLRIDGETQNRANINEDAVEDYCVLIQDADVWPFPPIDVFHDGSEYFVADGFHRTLGASRAKRASVPCNIHNGTARDARIFGMTANDHNGLRMTRADKRRCVEWLLANGGKMTQKEIANLAGVTSRTVKMIVAEQNPVSIAGKTKPSKGDGKGKTSPTIQPDDKTPEVAAEPEPEDLDFVEPTDAEIQAVDYGKCPNCAGEKWTEDEDGVSCAKCHHPHGEPTGGADEERIKTQRQKTIKTVEALQRAFDDLHLLLPRTDDHEKAVNGKDALCKVLLRMAKGWK